MCGWRGWIGGVFLGVAGYDVLVASDAVGMGLNLNIRRVVFSTLQKFDGKSVRQASVEEVGPPRVAVRG
jgi:hypothetical protein